SASTGALASATRAPRGATRAPRERPRPERACPSPIRFVADRDEPVASISGRTTHAPPRRAVGRDPSLQDLAFTRARVRRSLSSRACVARATATTTRLPFPFPSQLPFPFPSLFPFPFPFLPF